MKNDLVFCLCFCHWFEMGGQMGVYMYFCLQIIRKQHWNEIVSQFLYCNPDYVILLNNDNQ